MMLYTIMGQNYLNSMAPVHGNPPNKQGWSWQQKSTDYPNIHRIADADLIVT